MERYLKTSQDDSDGRYGTIFIENHGVRRVQTYMVYIRAIISLITTFDIKSKDRNLLFFDKELVSELYRFVLARLGSDAV